MQELFSNRRQRVLSLVMCVLIFASISLLANTAPQTTAQAAPAAAAPAAVAPKTVSGRTSSRVIPTTTNPAGTGDQGVRTMANTSFEINDSGCAMTSYQYARMSDMRGWFTSQA